MEKGFRWFVSAAAFLLSACGAERPSSSPKGHYEDYSPQELRDNAGQLAFVPEYAPGQNVMVSSEVFELQGYAMLSSIVEAGVQRIYLIPSTGRQGSPAPTLAELRQEAEKALAMRGESVDAQARAALDGIFARATVIPRQDPLYVPRGTEVFPTVWTRDWAPLTAKAQDGTYRVVDLNYYPERPWDDAVPNSFFQLMRGGVAGLRRVSLPVYNEGGNFMNTPDWCFMTTRVVEANSSSQASYTSEDARASGGRVSEDQVLGAADIERIYNSYGCKRTHIFQRLPHESTGHIDMWAKLLSADTVAVGDIWDEAIALLDVQSSDAASLGHKPVREIVTEVREAQAFLRAQQAWFAEAGFRVMKMPMPLGLWAFDSAHFEGRVEQLVGQGHSRDQARRQAEEESGWDLTRSYTNSLVANRTLVTPRYVRGEIQEWNPLTGQSRTRGFSYPDESLLPRYEAEVKRVSEAAGFRVSFVRTDELISLGGSVHCTTMQTPL